MITVGASVDPASVTMIDSIKVYIKSKVTFNWPDDDDLPDASATQPTAKEGNTSVTTTTTTSVLDSTDSIDSVAIAHLGRGKVIVYCTISL